MSRLKAAITPSDTTVASPLAKLWSRLTWDELDEWAGSRSVQRGRTYQRSGNVQQLGITAEGRLLANVIGSERYVTSVWRTEPGKSQSKIDSTCSCPVGYSGCKHAVAVVAEFLSVLAQQGNVPLVTDDDPRWARLEGNDQSADDDFDDSLSNDDDFDADDFDDDDDLDRAPARKPIPAKAASKRKTSPVDWKARVQQHIAGLNREQLAEKLWSLAQQYPEVLAEFREQILASSGQATELIAEARRELKRVTDERGWDGGWNEPGHTPDYSKLKRRLERLIELGQADAVVELGRDLLERGRSQMEESHDEGETGTELATCLGVVFAAALKSSLSPSQKILFAIDACLDDDYDLVGEELGLILDAEWPPAEWSLVANELQARTTVMSSMSDDDFTSKYRYQRINGWLLMALEHGGRKTELLAAHEREAQVTNDPTRLIAYLQSEGRGDDAEKWARDGIRANIDQYPGIADNLAALLCEQAQRRKQWDIVAAHAAVPFFVRPSAPGFTDLMKAARKAKCVDAVRAIALKFLETGDPPFQLTRTRTTAPTPSRRAVVKARKSTATTKAELVPVSQPLTAADVRVNPDWPLPLPDELAVLLRLDAPHRQPRPHLDVLLSLALEAKQPDDVLHWFDKMPQNEKGLGYNAYGFSTNHADQVAAAVAASHPERSLEIYGTKLNATLPHANTSAYEAATGYLRLMRPILKSMEREPEWQQLVAVIREKYRNRPRFMEALDKLDGRTILQTENARRKR